MTERLILLGAGGFARETLELVRTINSDGPVWDVVGLLDDNPLMHGQVVGDVMVLGPLEAAHDYLDAYVVATVASPTDPLRRLNVVDRLQVELERYATLVHPHSHVATSARIGRGSVLHANVVMTSDVEVGSHVAVMPMVVLTHDDQIGDGVTIASGVCLGGNVTVEDGAYIGAGALIREDITIHAGALVGMGSVVTRDVPAGEVWAGVPATALYQAATATPTLSGPR